jgi:hypothetical protein
VYRLTVRVELRLNGFLKLFAVGSVAGTFRLEDDGGTGAAASFHGNIGKPFRYTYRWLLHFLLAFFDAPGGSMRAVGVLRF